MLLAATSRNQLSPPAMSDTKNIAVHQYVNPVCHCARRACKARLLALDQTLFIGS